jgi:hypothetical protein
MVNALVAASASSRGRGKSALHQSPDKQELVPTGLNFAAFLGFHQSRITNHLPLYPSQPRNPASPATATTINGLILVNTNTPVHMAVRR